MTRLKNDSNRILPVLQGEFRVTSDPKDVLVTVLGSCVATCLWDEATGVGGMNHFLLAGLDEPKDGNLKYGINSMELLINSLLRAGANRENLRAKLFGGAKMTASSRQIGLENAEFAKWFLENESIPCESHCLGGDRGRKIRFQPATGMAKRMFLGDPMEIDTRLVNRRKVQAAASSTKAEVPEIELF